MSSYLFLLDIIHSGESLYVKKDVKMPVQGITFMKEIVILHSGTEQNSTDQFDTVLNFIPPVDSR